METFTQLFEHLADVRVLLCRPCTIAIPPAQIITHLKQHHRKVAVATRKDVAAVIRELPNLALVPVDVRIPEPAKEPIPGLQPPTDAYRCTSQGCWYVCTTLRQIRAHCTAEHGWVNNQRRGGDVRQKSRQSNNRLWQDKQTCQRLFGAAGWPAYLSVENSTSEPDVGNLSQRIKADRQHQRDEREAAAAQETIREGVRVQADPWLELTEWVPHLKGFSRAVLLHAREPARGEAREDSREEEIADEMGLGEVCKAMQRLIRKAFGSCRAEIVGRLALEIIERREVGAESNERPFYARHKVRTIQKYSQKLVSILCYLWRTHDQIERPLYKLTGK
jgi:hypothetical protein